MQPTRMHLEALTVRVGSSSRGLRHKKDKPHIQRSSISTRPHEGGPCHQLPCQAAVNSKKQLLPDGLYWVLRPDSSLCIFLCRLHKISSQTHLIDPHSRCVNPMVTHNSTADWSNEKRLSRGA